MSNGAAGGQAGPGTHMLHGSVWMIGLRWAIRLTGLVSTIILARLLTPKDFGVVAIAMIVVGLFEMLSETGQIRGRSFAIAIQPANITTRRGRSP